MRFLLFDVKPADNAVQQYLDIAAGLRPALEAQGGCLFIDRFRDLDDARWLLSFQIWRDEAALVAWRNNAQHHQAQRLGRERVFDDYRIRVGAVVMPGASDEGPHVAWIDSSAELAPGRSDVRRFASLYREGRFMSVLSAGTLAEVRDAAEALARSLPGAEVRLGRIERDYGMHAREQAPQVFPPRR